jgi:hypothetical protein
MDSKLMMNKNHSNQEKRFKEEYKERLKKILFYERISI